MLTRDNLMANRQPKSCPLPNGLCREKWIEYFSYSRLGNPLSIILNHMVGDRRSMVGDRIDGDAFTLREASYCGARNASYV
jgi:hypothetical protein